MGVTALSAHTGALYGYTGFVTQFFSAFTHSVFYFKLKIRVEVTLRTLSNKYDVPVTAAAPGTREAQPSRPRPYLPYLHVGDLQLRVEEKPVEGADEVDAGAGPALYPLLGQLDPLCSVPLHAALNAEAICGSTYADAVHRAASPYF